MPVGKKVFRQRKKNKKNDYRATFLFHLRHWHQDSQEFEHEAASSKKRTLQPGIIHQSQAISPSDVLGGSGSAKVKSGPHKMTLVAGNGWSCRPGFRSVLSSFFFYSSLWLDSVSLILFCSCVEGSAVRSLLFALISFFLVIQPWYNP